MTATRRTRRPASSVVTLTADDLLGLFAGMPSVIAPVPHVHVEA